MAVSKDHFPAVPQVYLSRSRHQALRACINQAACRLILLRLLTTAGRQTLTRPNLFLLGGLAHFNLPSGHAGSNTHTHTPTPTYALSPVLLGPGRSIDVRNVWDPFITA
jgi:hypothetical protein